MRQKHPEEETNKMIKYMKKFSSSFVIREMKNFLLSHEGSLLPLASPFPRQCHAKSVL